MAALTVPPSLLPAPGWNWDSGRIYRRYDVVLHGSSVWWLDQRASIGDPPSESTGPWVLLSRAGAPGDSSRDDFDGDGETSSYATSGVPLGLVKVYLNGLLQRPGGDYDYVSSALGDGRLVATFNTVPAVGSSIALIY